MYNYNTKKYEILLGQINQYNNIFMRRIGNYNNNNNINIILRLDFFFFFFLKKLKQF